MCAGTHSVENNGVTNVWPPHSAVTSQTTTPLEGVGVKLLAEK